MLGFQPVVNSNVFVMIAGNKTRLQSDDAAALWYILSKCRLRMVLLVSS